MTELKSLFHHGYLRLRVDDLCMVLVIALTLALFFAIGLWTLFVLLSFFLGGVSYAAFGAREDAETDA